MNIDQTPPAATNPSTTEDSKQQKLEKPSRNDNSNPQQGPGSVRHSDAVKSASHSDSASISTLKIPPTRKDSRKLFVGGLPSDGTYCISEFGISMLTKVLLSHLHLNYDLLQ
jgi:hypothetical protein